MLFVVDKDNKLGGQHNKISHNFTAPPPPNPGPNPHNPHTPTPTNM